MAKITDYSTLKSNVATWLNRDDLTDDIPTFIQLAEQSFRRDRRCRKLQDRGGFTISADGASLPSDFRQLEAWFHDGPTYFGEIEVVPHAMIGRLKSHFGDTGAPSRAAIVDGTVYFAPEPDSTYETKMSYWRKITALTDSNTTNWLLDENPDIYLYGALVEASPYLKDDARIKTWGTLLENALEGLHRATEDEHYGGPLRSQFTPIGG